MHCLVTGGAGFIGSHLCEYLLAQGQTVVALDNFNDYYDPRLKRRNVEPLLSRDGFKLVEADILDRPLLQQLFNAHPFEAIIHLAARAGVRPSIAQPLLYEQVNIQGTINLLELARQHQISKFIFGSTSSVYGENRKVPFAEDDPVDNPISPYAATKKAAELICYTYHHLYGVKVSCLRFFTVYGPRQRPDMAIHKFTQLMAAGQKVPMFGDGTTKRDYTYISDIVNGIYRALERCTSYHLYNLGESQTIELRRLIDLIAKNLGREARIERLPMQPGDVPMTYADVSRARRELGYEPRVNVEEGVRNFVEWFKEVHHLR
jgi:UDP-glucuronate 4-epimerase